MEDFRPLPLEAHCDNGVFAGFHGHSARDIRIYRTCHRHFGGDGRSCFFRICQLVIRRDTGMCVFPGIDRFASELVVRHSAQR